MKLNIQLGKIILSVLLLIVSSSLLGKDATVTWKPNSETDLSGYRVYYGPLAWMYDVGDTTAFTLFDLDDKMTHCFAVTAYDTANNESLQSRIVYTDSTVINIDIIASPMLEIEILRFLDQNGNGEIDQMDWLMVNRLISNYWGKVVK